MKYYEIKYLNTNDNRIKKAVASPEELIKILVTIQDMSYTIISVRQKDIIK